MDAPPVMNETISNFRIRGGAMKATVFVFKRAMVTSLLLMASYSILVLIQTPAYACTSFAVYAQNVYYGMNFDYGDVAMKLLILQSGDINTFHLAFERTLNGARFFVNTAGMNSKGLFAACQQVYPQDPSSERIDADGLYMFQLYDRIADTASTSDIIKSAESTRLINLPGLELHNLFADIHGTAVITESHREQNHITAMQGNYVVMTNFPNHTLARRSYAGAQGIGAQRYKKCHDYLRNHANAFTIGDGFELLRQVCNQDPEYPTRCSMVFDPRSNDIYIAFERNYSEIVKVSIATKTIESWQGYKDEQVLPLPVGEEGVLVADVIRTFR